MYLEKQMYYDDKLKIETRKFVIDTLTHVSKKTPATKIIDKTVNKIV